MNPVQRVLTPGPWPNPSAKTYTSISVALSIALVQIIGHNFFHGNAPDWVSTVIFILVPAAVTWIGGHFAQVAWQKQAQALAAPSPVSQSPAPVPPPAPAAGGGPAS